MSSQAALFTTDNHDAGVLRRIRVPSDVKVTAEINGPYRPKLKHVWGAGNRYVLWLMTNPSDARLEFTDMTVGKCGRLTRRWGYDGLMVGNACDHRHKNPKELLKVAAPRSQRNLLAILEMATESQLIILAHGRLPGYLKDCAAVMVTTLIAAGFGYKLHVLKLLPDGTPAHPLGRGKGHIPEDSLPIPYMVANGDLPVLERV